MLHPRDYAFTVTGTLPRAEDGEKISYQTISPTGNGSEKSTANLQKKTIKKLKKVDAMPRW